MARFIGFALFYRIKGRKSDNPNPLYINIIYYYYYNYYNYYKNIKISILFFIYSKLGLFL